MPWVGIYLAFTKHIYMRVCIFKTTERSFIDDGGRMKDFARPQVIYYFTGPSMVLMNHMTT